MPAGEVEIYHFDRINGKKVQAFRLAKGWTQKELSAAAGVGRGGIGDIERMSIGVSAKRYAKAIAEALGCDVEEILIRSNGRTNKELGL